MASLVVTGGAGFIGANFVHHWRARHPDDAILVVDVLTYAGNRASLDGLDGVGLLVADICDTAAMAQAMIDHDIDTIVHFAAESHVDRSITGPDAFVTTNVIGTHSLLKAAKMVWLDAGSGRPHRFHHVSTDEVYGSLGPEDPAFSEITPYAPNSPYSASKAGSDHLVRAYHHTFGLETTTTNCSNNYGPYQFPEKLIPLFLINALSGRSLPIYGDGMNVRDWLHVEDHCRGIEAALRHGRPGEVYNIGGGQELPNLIVIEEICRVVDAAFAAASDLFTMTISNRVSPPIPAWRCVTPMPPRHEAGRRPISRPTSLIARAMTGATQSTRPRRGPSSATRRRAISGGASPRRWPGTWQTSIGGGRCSGGQGMPVHDPSKPPFALSEVGGPAGFDVAQPERMVFLRARASTSGTRAGGPGTRPSRRRTGRRPRPAPSVRHRSSRDTRGARPRR